MALPHLSMSDLNKVLVINLLKDRKLNGYVCECRGLQNRQHLQANQLAINTNSHSDVSKFLSLSW